MASVSLSQPAGPQQQSQQQRRPLSEYVLESDLQPLCDQAAAAEQRQGGKPRVHLVVVGHVDAGKSSLMGRLLHDLGWVHDVT